MDFDEYVRIVDLPPGIGGGIMVDEDGNANIYINARHGRDAQLRTLEHEREHFIRDDLHNDDDIEMAEARADGHDRSAKLPRLMRAADLLPPPPPKPLPRKKINWPKESRAKRKDDRWDMPGDILDSDFVELHIHCDESEVYYTTW